MALSKKHFERFARRIKAQVEQAGEDKVLRAALNNLACDLAFDFRAENPNFDEYRFLKACGF